MFKTVLCKPLFLLISLLFLTGCDDVDVATNIQEGASLTKNDQTIIFETDHSDAKDVLDIDKRILTVNGVDRTDNTVTENENIWDIGPLRVVYQPVAPQLLPEGDVTINLTIPSKDRYFTAPDSYTKELHIFVDTLAPTIEALTPENNTTIRDALTVLKYNVQDAGSAINVSTLSIAINGEDATVLGSINNGILTIQPTQDFVLPEENITISVTLGDNLGNTITKVFNYIGSYDEIPPSVIIVSPNPGASITDPLTPLIFDVHDDINGSGLDESSVKITFTDTNTSHMLVFDANSNTYRYFPSVTEPLALGNIAFTVYAKDQKGNEASFARTVTLIDVTPPVLVLNGEANITLEQNANYIELGATATDNSDGNISVEISGSVDTSREGSYTLTYTATDSSGNSASVTRVVTVKNKVIGLTLVSKQTNIVRTKDPIAREYMPAILDIKAMATYTDGHSEEVTDKVTWQGADNKVAINGSRGVVIFYDEDNLTLKATYEDIQSNPVTLSMQNIENTGAYLYTTIYNSNSTIFHNRGAGVEMTLLKEPKSDVVLPVRLESKDKVGFEYSDVHTQLLHFKAGIGWDRPQAVTIVDNDTNSTQPYTLITDAFESNDTAYDGIDPKDIVVTPHTSIELIVPALRQRKGAIRGVRIEMILTAKSGNVKDFRLVNPPKGMHLAVPPLHSIDEFEEMSKSAKSIIWDIPMDIEEDKTYNITAEVTDEEGKKGSVTFPVKVLKTTPIQTEVKNNELIVTDKNSPLYSMKLKVHNGGDISNVKLRSVEYGDVWRLPVKNKKEGDVVQRVVYVMDNMPDAVDLKFPEYDNTLEKAKELGASLFRYTSNSFGDYWIHADRNAYQYEGTDGVTIPHMRYAKEYSGSRVFLDIVRKSQLIGSQK